MASLNRYSGFLQLSTMHIYSLFPLVKPIHKQPPADGVYPVFSPKIPSSPNSLFVFFQTIGKNSLSLSKYAVCD